MSQLSVLSFQRSNSMKSDSTMRSYGLIGNGPKLFDVRMSAQDAVDGQAADGVR